jgi:hypothetical protein
LLQQVDLLAGAERWREGGRDARSIRRFAQVLRRRRSSLRPHTLVA